MGLLFLRNVIAASLENDTLMQKGYVLLCHCEQFAAGKHLDTRRNIADVIGRHLKQRTLLGGRRVLHGLPCAVFILQFSRIQSCLGAVDFSGSIPRQHKRIVQNFEPNVADRSRYIVLLFREFWNDFLACFPTALAGKQLAAFLFGGCGLDHRLAPDMSARFDGTFQIFVASDALCSPTAVIRTGHGRNFGVFAINMNMRQQTGRHIAEFKLRCNAFVGREKMIASLTVDNDFVRRIDQRLVDFRTVDYGQMKRYRSIVGARSISGQSAAQRVTSAQACTDSIAPCASNAVKRLISALSMRAPSTALTATAFPAPGGVYKV